MSSIFTSWPVLFVSALMYHIGKILTFKHNGAGLPKLGSSFLPALSVLFLAASLARHLMYHPDMTAGGTMVTGVIFLGILYLIVQVTKKPLAFAGYLMTSMGLDVATVGVGLVLGPVPEVDAVASLWCLIAFTVLFSRLPREDS